MKPIASVNFFTQVPSTDNPYGHPEQFRSAPDVFLHEALVRAKALGYSRLLLNRIACRGGYNSIELDDWSVLTEAQRHAFKSLLPICGLSLLKYGGHRVGNDLHRANGHYIRDIVAVARAHRPWHAIGVTAFVHDNSAPEWRGFVELARLMGVHGIELIAEAVAPHGDDDDVATIAMYDHPRAPWRDPTARVPLGHPEQICIITAAHDKVPDDGQLRDLHDRGFTLAAWARTTWERVARIVGMA